MDTKHSYVDNFMFIQIRFDSRFMKFFLKNKNVN